MAIGDQADMLGRLKGNLPAGWFPDDTPVLDAILAAPAAMWSWLYGMLEYVRLQTRLQTATDVWLDMAADDYLGPSVARFVAEGDPAFSLRIQANLLPERVTRSAVIGVVTALTGTAPDVFEPANTGDTGGYGSGEAAVWSGMAYGAAGGWGSLALPFQAFLHVHRPHQGGIASIGGYYTGTGWAGGGYGVGAIEYISRDMLAGQVTDDAIYQTISAAAPAGTIMWTQISA